MYLLLFISNFCLNLLIEEVKKEIELNCCHSTNSKANTELTLIMFIQ